VDHVEYEIDPDVWIRRLRDSIANGSYEPETPERSNLAKSFGFARTITHPSIPDAVLYRAICDHIFVRAKRHQREHVYFQRGDQAAANLERLRALGIYRRTATPGDTWSASAARAETRSPKDESDRGSDDADDNESPEYGNVRELSWFINWRLMTLFRTDLIEPTEPERWFVLTDITNFFDSVLHDHVAEALRAFSIPRRMIGLLLFLLERLAVRKEYAHSAAIGLPVDLVGGSRTLAHVILFSHDDEVTSIVGESSYLRWMDDQLFVVESRPAALTLLGQIQTSLGRLHLTPNVKKTKILTRDEAYRHFHVDINRDLDACHHLPYQSMGEKRKLGQRVRQAWKSAAIYINTNTGESGKVLRRFYLYAARSGMRFLRKRCLDDILRDPLLAERVASYVRHVNGPGEFWRFGPSGDRPPRASIRRRQSDHGRTSASP
jgi:hypothetical protein